MSETLSKALGRIGYDLGVAFQIIDDILDFSDNQAHVGKSTRNDLKKGYFTLPVIFAIQGEKEAVLELNETQMVALIKKNKGIEKARMLAQKYTKRAFDRIKSLPEGDSKIAMVELANYLLNRTY